MANEKGRRRDPLLKIAAEFLVLVIGLGVCAIFLQHKITNLLTTTIEQIVARQTSDMANLAEEQFQRELTVLRYAAEDIALNPDRSGDILHTIDNHSKKGDISGIVTVDGDFVLGATLPANDFLRLPWAVRGYDVVDFSYGKGLLLAVPIISGDNVRGILWRLYDDKRVREQFGLSKYNSDRHFIITAHDGQTIVPYKKDPDENEQVFSDPSIQEGFEKIRDQLPHSRLIVNHKDLLCSHFLNLSFCSSTHVFLKVIHSGGKKKPRKTDQPSAGCILTVQ